MATVKVPELSEADYRKVVSKPLQRVSAIDDILIGRDVV